MHPTRNDLPKNKRQQSVDLLNPILAELLDLGLQAKQAHWNVKGPHFIALHELFDDIYESIEALTDTVAERITALGGVALGTLQSVDKLSELTPYPVSISSGHQHVEALSMAIAACGKRVRRGIDKADKTGDKGTSDVCTEVSRTLDKHLWFVEAHAEGAR